MKPVAPVTKYAIAQARIRPTMHPAPGTAAALAGREAGGAARAFGEDLGSGLGLQGEPLGERHAQALDRRAAVGEHRALREARQSLGERERALQVRARGHDLGQQAHRQRLARRRSCARSGSGRARAPARRCAAAAGCRRRSAARPSAARGSRASSPRWRCAGRTTAPAPARPRGRSPEIAAIVGLEGVSRVKPIGPSADISRPAIVSVAFRSAPAQNDTPPAPVSTITRASSSASKRTIRLVQPRGRIAVDGVAPVLAVDRHHAPRRPRARSGRRRARSSRAIAHRAGARCGYQPPRHGASCLRGGLARLPCASPAGAESCSSRTRTSGKRRSR